MNKKCRDAARKLRNGGMNKGGEESHQNTESLAYRFCVDF